MRDLDPLREAEFFALFRDYYDLERNTGRHYGQGEYTLERMDALARLAGHPEQRLRLVHVAGTKGKGSTCYFAAALLHAAGIRCGTYTSPHLRTVRERFQIDGQWVDYDLLLREGQDFRDTLRSSGMQPTLFEIMTVLALRIFARQECTWAVVETGIGGLLDATNYFLPEACAITAVSLDHTQLLGSTIAEIAAQKAGIIKPGVPVVCGRQPYSEAERIIRDTAARLRAPVFTPVANAALDAWPVAALPDFLRENFCSALRIAETLGLSPLPAVFHLPSLPARFECLRRVPPLVIDAAHNADSAARLAASLAQAWPGTAFTTVLGITAGKDVEGIFRALVPVTGEFILTHPRTRDKGSELPHLQDLALAAGVRYRVIEEISDARQLPGDAALLFTGSFFTALIGDALFGAQQQPAGTTSRCAP